ncbi:Nto1 protein [Maudiozyma humilis]|uniref:Nto1 protein n=1 Tax=Maudiozyma humilis TaxID=51915 RepID=A0AAV5RWK0_MAUHU|nr:Nto1 protein [Kazachstania humilis]
MASNNNTSDDGPKLREEKPYEDFYPLLKETDLIPLIFDKECLQDFQTDSRDWLDSKTSNIPQCKQIIFEGKTTTEPLNIGNSVVDFHKPSIKINDLNEYEPQNSDSRNNQSHSKMHTGDADVPSGNYDTYETKIRHRGRRAEMLDISVIEKHSPGLRHFKVQYDMDEQDCLFLEHLHQLYNDFSISELQFEGLMSILEYQWAYIQKHLPIPSPPVVYLDQLCSVCGTEETPTNTIIFCDCCNLAVHQECYGILFIPPGPWLCRACAQKCATLTRPYCCVCPEIGGPLKQTTCGTWVHVWCAVWVRELCFGNWHYLEPVEGIEKIPASRWRLVCSVCKLRNGACVQCSNKNCFTAFHVSCAMKSGFQMTPLKTGSLAEMALGTEKLECFCDKHSLPILDVRERIATVREEFAHSNTFAILDKEITAQNYNPLEDDISNIRRFPIAPMVFAHQLQKVLQTFGVQNINTLRGVSTDICKYWSLKREYNGGAPLFEHTDDKTYSYDLMTEEQIDETVYFGDILSSDLKSLEGLASLVHKRTGVLVDKLAADRVVTELVTAPDRYFLKNVVLKSFITADVFKTITYNLDHLGYSHIIEDCHNCNFSSVSDFRQRLKTTFQEIIYSDSTTRTVRQVMEKASGLVDKLTDGLADGALGSMLQRDFVLDNPANITERQWAGLVIMEEEGLSDAEELSNTEQRALNAVMRSSEQRRNESAKNTQNSKTPSKPQSTGTVKKRRKPKKKGW